VPQLLEKRDQAAENDPINPTPSCPEGVSREGKFSENILTNGEKCAIMHPI
jgi:hypothetical protein